MKPSVAHENLSPGKVSPAFPSATPDSTVFYSYPWQGALEYDCPSMTLPLHVPAYSTTPFIFCTVLLLFDIILTIIFVYGFIFSLL